MKKILKWLIIIIASMMSLSFLIVFSPITLIISLIALWYFVKKKPNTKYRKYAKNGVIASTIGLGLFIFAINSDVEDTNIGSDPPIDEIVKADVKSETELAKELEEKERLERLKQEKQEERKRNEEEKKLQEEEEQRVKEEEEQRLIEEARLKELEEQEKLEKEKAEKELTEANPNKSGETEAPFEPITVPEGKEDVVVNNNIPFFSNEDISSTEVYHLNGSLDSSGRETAANALVGVDIMPAEQRGSIGHIEPSGWNQANYANIGAGGWLYNRSHLIGHQMTGNDDRENLMTGTRWFNMRMLEYENWVANYVETTENHVRYRVTPVFEGNNLVASGAYMEGFSIEDNGEGVMFNVYVPNVQPGVEINYANGSSVGPAGPAEEGEISNYNSGSSDISSDTDSSNNQETSKPAPSPKPEESNPYVDANGNGLIKGSSGGIYHVPGSSYYDRTTNPAQMFKSVEEAEAAGYRAPKR